MKRYWERWKIFLSARSNPQTRERALRYVWEEYCRPLAWYIRSLDPQAGVEDVIQEVLIRVWEHMADYDPAWAFSTWIYTITRNLVWKNTGTIWQELDENTPAAGPDIAEVVQMKSDNQKAGVYLERLGNTDSRIAFFRFSEGLTYQDIAVLLDMPVGTVKYRVHAIRKGLKKLLGGTK